MKRMKKIIAMAIALMMILTTLTAIVPSAAAVETTGDVAREPVPAMADFNGDGKLDSADVLAMLRHLMNPAKYPWDHPHDFNADGRETVTDAIYFLRHIFFGDVYELNFACTAHNEASYADVAATCTAPGYTGGTYCSLCGQTLTERTVVPARGHNYVDGVCDICGDIKTSTCTGEHNFVDNVCTNCGERGSAGLTYSTYSSYAQVTGMGTCTDTELIIPKTYMGKPVTDIGYSAFQGNTAITSVEMQDGMQNVYYNAFYGCTALTSVSVPDSITDIVNGAFNKCTNLQFNVYDNANYLGNANNKYVILYKAKATSVSSREIHADTKVINNYAFEDCRNLVSITIPDGVIRIGDYAFSSCSQLTAMNIPASVSSIGTAPFEYCSNLSTLMVANDNEYYCAEDGILYNKSKTEIIAALPACVSGTVAIPDSVVTILPYAFENCGNITSIQFGENSNLEAVRYYAFKDCVLLESINFLESVNNIHYGAFVECVKLTGITVDDANSNYSTDGMVVFNKDKTSIMLVSGALTGEYVIPDSVTTLADGAFAYSNVTSVVIHDGITDIPEVAFNHCRKLNSIYIGKGVTHIGSLAFQWCDKLEYIYYSGTEAEWAAIKKDSLWDHAADEYSVICSDTVIDCTNSKHDFVNNICTRCGERGSAGLEYQTTWIYNSVTGEYDIEQSSVVGIGTCTDTEIIIPKTYKGKTVTGVDYSAFENNTSITSIELPSTITNINYGAFCGCSALTTIKFAGTKAQWNAITFGYQWKTNSAITTIICSDGEIIVPPCEVGEHDFVNNVCTYCGERGSAGLKYSTNSSYARVTGMGTCTDTELIIPKTYMGKPVTDIGYSAFQGNTAITSVEMQDGMQNIYYNAFYGCTALTSVSVPDSICIYDTYRAKRRLICCNIYYQVGCCRIRDRS